MKFYINIAEFKITVDTSCELKGVIEVEIDKDISIDDGIFIGGSIHIEASIIKDKEIEAIAHIIGMSSEQISEAINLIDFGVAISKLPKMSSDSCFRAAIGDINIISSDDENLIIKGK